MLRKHKHDSEGHEHTYNTYPCAICLGEHPYCSKCGERDSSSMTSEQIEKHVDFWRASRTR